MIYFIFIGKKQKQTKKQLDQKVITAGIHKAHYFDFLSSQIVFRTERYCRLLV